jgi:hypothetical protein
LYVRLPLPPLQELKSWGIYVAVMVVGLAVAPGFASGMALLNARVKVTAAWQAAFGSFGAAGLIAQPHLLQLLGPQGVTWMVFASFAAMFVLLLLECKCPRQGGAAQLHVDELRQPLLPTDVLRQQREDARQHGATHPLHSAAAAGRVSSRATREGGGRGSCTVLSC